MTINDGVTQSRLLPDERLDIEADHLDLDVLAHVEVQPASRELIESVRALGILQPILVRYNENEYDIVDGRRRLDAARKVGLTGIPVMVALTDLSIADVATLAANATRRSNPVAEFDAIQRLAKQGATIKHISGATGMSLPTIKARIGLMRLSPALTGAFRAGKITTSVAEGAAKLPPSLQEILAATLLTKGRLTETDIHTVRTARSQQATAQLPDTLFAMGEVHHHAVNIGPQPLEAELARELQGIIGRMPPVQGVLIRSLEWVAAMLMDIAAGTVAVVERDGPLSPADMAIMYPADHPGVDWYGNDPEEPPMHDEPVVTHQDVLDDERAEEDILAARIEREEIDERAGRGARDDDRFADEKTEAERYFDEIERT